MIIAQKLTMQVHIFEEILHGCTVQLDLNFMNTRVCNSARTTRV